MTTVGRIEQLTHAKAMSEHGWASATAWKKKHEAAQKLLVRWMKAYPNTDKALIEDTLFELSDNQELLKQVTP